MYIPSKNHLLVTTYSDIKHCIFLFPVVCIVVVVVVGIMLSSVIQWIAGF